MEYFDEATKRKYVPHVIEPSLGVDRLFLALLTSAYHEDEVKYHYYAIEIYSLQRKDSFCV
jgi:glycyl-tRNA synthetase (class II)